MSNSKGKGQKPKVRNNAGGYDTKKAIPIAEPNPNGNRAERRAAVREAKNKPPET